MLKCVRSRTAAVMMFVVLLSIVVGAGCMGAPRGVLDKGLVAWNYESRVSNETQTPVIPGTVAVRDIVVGSPEVDGGGIGALLRLFPIMSAFAPPVRISNLVVSEKREAVGLRSDEMGRLIAEELRKSGVAKNVIFGDGKADYQVRGRAGFTVKRYAHSSGLGSIVYIFSLLGMATLPDSSIRMTGNAYLELVSADGKKVLFAKDYAESTLYQRGSFYGQSAQWRLLGEELYPRIFAQFVKDVQALPKTAWQR